MLSEKPTIPRASERTERLSDWAIQFYNARSAVAHEGRVRDWRFYAVVSKQAGKAHTSGNVLTFGREIFQLCVSTILIGAHLAERAGLKDKLVANSERYIAISKILANSAKPAHDRLLEVGPTVEALNNFSHIESGSLTVPGMTGGVRLAARALLDGGWTGDAPVMDALNRLVATRGAESDLVVLTAIEGLLAPMKGLEALEYGSPERIFRDLVEHVWSGVFMYFYSLKQAAGAPAGSEDP
jgi:hypothetical protein